ncbi:MAG: hypothetical protein LBC71_08265 [Oscillospiraceae bacterium]|nr:hypothetical protein [Oscillospiraceae bacterium]
MVIADFYGECWVVIAGFYGECGGVIADFYGECGGEDGNPPDRTVYSTTFTS